jgi:hypothetical protein
VGQNRLAAAHPKTAKSLINYYFIALAIGQIGELL